MKKKQGFTLNQTIQLCFPGDDRFHSTLIQDLRTSILYVSVPTVRGQALIPPRDQEIKGRFFAGDAIYLFSTAALGLKTGDRVPLLMLKRPAYLERRQRRDYYRRSTSCSLTLALVGEGEDNMETASSELSWFEARTMDLGGGGLRFLSTVKIDKSRQVILKVSLQTPRPGGRDVVQARGQIVRVEELRAGTYVYSVKFIVIKERDQDRIINFVFNLASNKVN